MWYIVAGAVIGIYLLVNLLLGKVVGGFTNMYVVQPALWIALALIVLRLPAVRSAGRSSFKRHLILPAALAGVLHIMVLATAGVMTGFGSSPYSFTPTGIIVNIIYVGSALVGIELARAYLVNSLSKKRPTLVVVLVALVFTFLMIPMTKYGNLTGARTAVTFLGETWMPLLAMNLLATFLAYLGGPLPAMAYRGIVAGFEWFSPVLPDLTPMLTALAGTLGPVAGFALIQYGVMPAYSGPGRRNPRERKASTPLPAGWIATGVVGVALIWFFLGLFPIFPTVIYSGSMSPAINVGDLVIVSDVPPEKIRMGDIIKFQTEGGPYVHRVVEIFGEGKDRVFVTQGDANKNPDADPVMPAQVRGRVIYNVPKIGWAAVGVKDWLFAPAQALPSDTGEPSAEYYHERRD